MALLGVALFTLIGLLTPGDGMLMTRWVELLTKAFGVGAYVLPLGLGAVGVWVAILGTDSRRPWSWSRTVGLALLFVCMLMLAHHLGEPSSARPGAGLGGLTGSWVSQALTRSLGWAGALVVAIVVAAIALFLALNVPPAEVVSDGVQRVRAHHDRIRHWRMAQRARSVRRPVIESPPARPPAAETRPTQRVAPSGTASARPALTRTPTSTAQTVQCADVPGLPGADLGVSDDQGPDWMVPQVDDVLDEIGEPQMSLSDMRDKARTIEETLRSLGVPVTVVEVNPGPVVTQFGLEPGYTERRERDGKIKRMKVKVSRISALSNDLALALAAAPIRIEAPVPGKGVVGLEVPNLEAATVGLRSVMESTQFQALSTQPLAVGLGRDVSGASVVADLARLPHLLIAGATGSGKSVCINSLIACLLLRNSPDVLKLLMIDPKRVELSVYNGIPHLIAPVVVDAGRVVGVLNWVTREMDRRYKAFARAGARNLASFNELALERGETHMPRIVVFVDELADLMMVAPEDVERSICRIAQMARATGIHLVIATQRPSVDVVTGLIKANFPARISFAVSSAVDSRVVLDAPGADKLLGRGDCLYMAPDSPKLLRVQGCFVSDGELTRLVELWRVQASLASDKATSGLSGVPSAGISVVQRPLWPEMAPQKTDKTDDDPMLQDAVSLVISSQRVSVSFLQRRLGVGYTRASRLVDALEERGVIGPLAEGNRLREVLVKEAKPEVEP